MRGGREIDYAALESALQARPKVVYAQRSRGYGEREGLSCAQLCELYAFVKRVSPASYVVVDNCYGEFLETSEPKADLLVGSFIKNPGGGLADTGGYIAGGAACVELAACRLTSPGIGGEMGATLDQTKKMLRGLFYAPHTVLQALKTAAFAAYVLERLGFEVSPGRLRGGWTLCSRFISAANASSSLSAAAFRRVSRWTRSPSPSRGTCPAISTKS